MSGVLLSGGVVKKCRKTHRCYWCDETIMEGSRYCYWTWVGDNTIEKVKCHPECLDAWSDAAEGVGRVFLSCRGEHKRGSTDCK